MAHTSELQRVAHTPVARTPKPFLLDLHSVDAGREDLVNRGRRILERAGERDIDTVSPTLLSVFEEARTGLEGVMRDWVTYGEETKGDSRSDDGIMLLGFTGSVAVGRSLDRLQEQFDGLGEGGLQIPRHNVTGMTIAPLRYEPALDMRVKDTEGYTPVDEIPSTVPRFMHEPAEAWYRLPLSEIKLDLLT